MSDGVNESEVRGGEKGVGPSVTEDRARIRRGVVLTLLGGTFWGLNGTLAKYLMDSYAIDPLWLACLRQLTACWLFLGAAWLRDRDRLAQVVRLPRELLGILGVGLGAILFSQVAYLEAIDWTNSATATVLQSLSTLGVLAYVCVANRRGPRRRELLGLALALAGVYLVTTGGNPGQLNLAPGGIFWGLAAAAAAACLAIMPAKYMARWGNFAVNGLAFLFSGIILAAVYQPWLHMPALDATAVVLLALCVVVGTFGAYALFLQGVHDAGSMRAGLLATVEPVSATIATVLVMQTAFSATDLLGFALILAMVFLTV